MWVIAVDLGCCLTEAEREGMRNEVHSEGVAQSKEAVLEEKGRLSSLSTRRNDSRSGYTTYEQNF